MGSGPHAKKCVGPDPLTCVTRSVKLRVQIIKLNTEITPCKCFERNTYIISVNNSLTYGIIQNQMKGIFVHQTYFPLSQKQEGKGKGKKKIKEKPHNTIPEREKI